MDTRAHQLSELRDSAAQRQDTVAPDLRQPSGPKIWAECGIEEKVERLRSLLIDLRSAFGGTRETCERLARHDHDAVGHVMVPLDDRRFAGGTGFDWLA